MAVLSQIEPTPGAVTAAQAVPEDCDGWPSGEYFCRSTSALVEAEGWLTTVISAPIRVSQNGDSDCLTKIAEVPFGLALDDHDASPPSAAFGAVRPFATSMLNVKASTLSWLQSSLSISMSFPSISFMSTSLLSASLISRAGSCSAASAASSDGGGACAPAGSTAARLKPAASASSHHTDDSGHLRDVLKIIAPPDASRANMRSFWREIMAGPFAAHPVCEIRGKCSGRPSACSTSS